MKLAIATATAFLAAATALPAFAATPAPRDIAPYQQGYRDGAAADAYLPYAAAPFESPRAARRAASGWGHCVRGEESSTYSAFPSWDVCRGG
jgi:hypothetical protein